MSHERRPETPVELQGHVGDCPACGKKRYRSRKAAKSSARRIYPGRQVRFYQCDGSPYWHVTSQSAARAAAWRDWQAASS